jgi:hypothetical protein
MTILFTTPTSILLLSIGKIRAKLNKRIRTIATFSLLVTSAVYLGAKAQRSVIDHSSIITLEETLLDSYRCRLRYHV